MQMERCGFRLAVARRAAVMAPPYPDPIITMSYWLRRSCQGVCSIGFSVKVELLPGGRIGPGQQVAEVVVEKPAVGIERLPRLGEGGQPVSQSLLDHRRRETECLVHQRHAAPIAAELVISSQEFRPTGISG